MRRFLAVLLFVVMLLSLSACSKPEPTAENPDVPEGYTVYPQNAHTIMYTKQARDPPKSIFTRPKEAIGILGNMFKFIGEVVSVNIGDEYNDMVIHTKNGYVKIIDLYSLLVNDAPGIETDKLNERFSIPKEGDKVCVYAEYSGGNREVFGCPVAYIGGKPTVARVTGRTTQYINSRIYKDYDIPEIVLLKEPEQETMPEMESDPVFDEITEVESLIEDDIVSDATEESQTYILNTNTNKFHYSTCSDVSRIKEENKSSFYGTRDEAIADGYEPCGHCNP